MPLYFTIACLMLIILEIIFGIKTRGMLRGKALLFIAGLHFLAPIAAVFAYILFSSKQPAEVALFYVVFTLCAEAVLAFSALMILIVVFTGMVTKIINSNKT